MLHTILFDLDGTLIDTMDLIVACFQHATGRHCEREITREEVLPTIGLPLHGVLEGYAPGLGDTLYAAYQEYNRAHHDRLARLVPGTVEMLVTLRARGIACGLVTSKRRASWQMGLDLFGLAPYLDVIVGLEDSTQHKPQPEPVLAALARLGRDPHPTQVAYVGDAASDMACAQAAGVRAIGVAWGAAPPEVLAAAGAVPVLTSWADLLALVQEG